MAFDKVGVLKFVNSFLQSWNVDENDFLTLLHKRGLEDSTMAKFSSKENLLKHYHYPHDAGALYTFFLDYVTEILSEVYTDISVSEDIFFRAFLNEVDKQVDIGGFKKFPNSVNTINDAAKLIATIIWTITVQHSAVNYPQFYYLGYIPNYPPGSLLQPLPTSVDDLTKIDEAYICSSLQQVSQEYIEQTMTNLLSTPVSPENSLLGLYRILNKRIDSNNFVCMDRDKARRYVDLLNQRLIVLSQSINHRNQKLDKPLVYDYLNPSNVSRSILL